MPALICNVLLEKGADFQRLFDVVKSDGTELPNFDQYTGSGTLETLDGKRLIDIAVVLTAPRTVLAKLSIADMTDLPSTTEPLHQYRLTITAPNGGPTYRIAQGTVIISVE